MQSALFLNWENFSYQLTKINLTIWVGGRGIVYCKIYLCDMLVF